MDHGRSDERRRVWIHDEGRSAAGSSGDRDREERAHDERGHAKPPHGGHPDGRAGPTAEALRQLLASSDFTPLELARLLDIGGDAFVDYWSGSRPMTKSMALRTARLLEERARDLTDLAAELRTLVWRLPST